MLPCDYVIWDGWSVRTWWAEKVRYSLFEPLSWSNAKKEPLLKNLKCIPFRLYPIQPSGFWRPVGEPSRTFLPFRPILFIIHQLGLGRTNLNCRSCRLDESSKRGGASPHLTRANNLTSEFAFSRCPWPALACGTSWSNSDCGAQWRCPTPTCDQAILKLPSSNADTTIVRPILPSAIPRQINDWSLPQVN